MDGYLVILDPMPLSGGEVPFYDGQPRDARKRFTFGKRIDIASSVGIDGKVSMNEAKTMLERPLVIHDSAGRRIVLDMRLYWKYIEGAGRKGGPDEQRILQVGRAVFAIKNANSGVIELPNHNPPQRQYLHKFGERKAVAVYVDASGYSRSIIYNSHKNADKFIENKKGR